MRRGTVRWAAVLLTALLPAVGARAASAAPASVCVRVVTIGPVEPALKTGVIAWLEEQAGPTRDDGARDDLAARGPADVARALTVVAAEHAPAPLTLGLVADGAGRFPAQALWTTNRIALVNIKGLQPTEPRAGDAARRLLWRVQREAVNGLALALGMEECPILFCALYNWPNERELDLKSRNLCPPCKDKFDTRLRACGLPPAHPDATAPTSPEP